MKDRTTSINPRKRTATLDADRVPSSRFDYRDYPPAQRLAEFQFVTGTLYDVSAAGDNEAFRVEATGHYVDDLIFSRVAFSPARFTRDERHLHGKSGSFLVLQHQLAGSEVLQMEHGKVLIESGSLYLRDWSFPFDSQATEMRLDSIVVPRHRLKAADILDASLPVVSWPADSPEGQSLASIWISLLEYLPHISLGKAQVLANGLLAFVDAMLGGGARAKPAKTLHAMEQFLLVRLRTDIGVDDLCRHFSVSRSQLYRLFEPHDGVQAHIKRLRLKHCYSHLLRADPAHTRVTDVASSWGFQDASLFSRQFRAEYGRSPSAVLSQTPDIPASVRDQFAKSLLESKSYGSYLAWLRRANDD
jgi:AraC-like DNA-binding protein